MIGSIPKWSPSKGIPKAMKSELNNGFLQRLTSILNLQIEVKEKLNLLLQI
jgi:hypothetical protein